MIRSEGSAKATLSHMDETVNIFMEIVIYRRVTVQAQVTIYKIWNYLWIDCTDLPVIDVALYAIYIIYYITHILYHMQYRLTIYKTQTLPTKYTSIIRNM